jgi:hypothetical protein
MTTGAKSRAAALHTPHWKLPPLSANFQASRCIERCPCDRPALCSRSRGQRIDSAGVHEARMGWTECSREGLASVTCTAWHRSRTRVPLRAGGDGGGGGGGSRRLREASRGPGEAENSSGTSGLLFPGPVPCHNAGSGFPQMQTGVCGCCKSLGPTPLPCFPDAAPHSVQC